MLDCESFMRNRYSILEEYQSKLCISPNVNGLNIKHSIRNKRFELVPIDLRFSFPSLVYSLPLPRVSSEWGVAQLIIRLRLRNLINVLILLLLERSVLIVGERSEEVSACTFALLELLAPYKWASIFLPLLSEDMIDFVSSPVPFIAGMIGRDRASLKRIKTDHRVEHERMDGLTIIDLSDGNILWTKKNEFENNMFASFEKMMEHWYRHRQLHCYQQRLNELSMNETSSLRCFKSFLKVGMSVKEFKILESIKKSMADFFAHFSGSISKYKDGWKDFSVIDGVTNQTNLCEKKFISHTANLLEFQKIFSKTQLLASFFDERKINYKDEEHHAAKFIADWLYYNMWKSNKSCKC